MNIFVSYTSRDSEITEELLRKISVKLSKYGWVFIDLLHNNSLTPQAKVFEALEKSDLLIVLDTKSVRDSKWVILELEKANECQIPIQWSKPGAILETTFFL